MKDSRHSSPPARSPHPGRRQMLLGATAAALLAGCGDGVSAASGSGPRATASGPDGSGTGRPSTRTTAPGSSTPPGQGAGDPSATTTAQGTAAAQSPAATPSASPTGATGATSPAIDLAADPATIARRPAVPILCYHQIREWTSDDSDVDRAYIMPPRIFTAQLDALAGAGYQTISPEQLLAHLTTGAAMPRKPVMLTYDDSVVDGYDVAAPAMAERGFTGTYFLMTVVLGKHRYLSKAQVRELDAMGMTIGAHTWDHHRVDRYSGDDWRVQLQDPAETIAGIVGHAVPLFAYPFGVWDAEAFPHLQEAGYHAAFQLDAEDVDPRRPLYTIRRAIANPSWSTDSLLSRVAGWA